MSSVKKDLQDQKMFRKTQQKRNAGDRKALPTFFISRGDEPENIRKRIDILFPNLDAAYPDKQIIALHKDHKKWGKTVTELYRLLGYPDGRAFLEAYGYTVVDNKGGRSASNNYDGAILELQKRYPNGSGFTTVSALQVANSDLPIKSLSIISKTLYGMSPGEYLKKKGILS